MSEKSKFGAIFILLVVFAIGSLCGIGSTIFYLRQAHDRLTGRQETFTESKLIE